VSENNQAATIMWRGLTQKRADLIWEIEQSEKHTAELKAQLIHLDATLRIFRPDFALEGLPVKHRRPTKSPYFEHGELTARIYDALRDNPVAATADIAVKAMYDKALDPVNDQPTRKDFVRRFNLQLKQLVREGTVEKVGGRGPACRWRLNTDR
jgi:hypothetical protein